ncbi:transmembrane protein (Protein of unknown function DUF2359, transmembrane) [Thalictrum thalictroides]|uniref:EngC GTPase domain-containing protein n=1 Tax=Thalictrum thalictroides TaxID=46969 RepID=A0A7J6X440_THATH|nr:transmembrane protein (Protein of unknown function DUF2359, transmembrane) [Thalictrum thalictroides]
MDIALVPPSPLELLIRTTFPAPSARIKATERFEAAYPTLKELALAGTPGSKAMKEVTQQIFTFAVKAAGEGMWLEATAFCYVYPDLSNEATSIGIWCLTQNPDCYKQWEKIYLDNVQASVAVLKKLSEEWKEHNVKHASLDPLRETIKNFRQKTQVAWDKKNFVRGWGYKPIFCSIETKFILREQTSVIVGPSGVGKSSLINALRGSSMHVSEEDNWLARVSFLLICYISTLKVANGSMISEWPILMKVTKKSLSQLFPEVRKMLGASEPVKCSFSDCLHILVNQDVW